jgi:hypothetical protein
MVLDFIAGLRAGVKTSAGTSRGEVDRIRLQGRIFPSYDLEARARRVKMPMVCTSGLRLVALPASTYSTWRLGLRLRARYENGAG